MRRVNGRLGGGGADEGDLRREAMAGGRVAAYDERAAAWALALACDREVVGFGESKKDMQINRSCVMKEASTMAGERTSSSSIALGIPSDDKGNKRQTEVAGRRS
ncbi:hypothetical protein DM860_009109 [Cuscuta australis]|uniref:Uncharacterized protein n=1 Tax=Cuscuta australis TaxID=267555 RepID=A0A328D813_9ASTE|nr:hypothetical protein DM860_009109 [Cuscuta australis]